MVPLFFAILFIEYTNAQGTGNCSAVGGVCTQICDSSAIIPNISCTSVGSICCRVGKPNYTHCSQINRQCRLGGGRCVADRSLTNKICPYLGVPNSCCTGQTCCIGPTSSTCLLNTRQCIKKGGNCVKSDDCISTILGDYCGPSCSCCLKTCDGTVNTNCIDLYGTCRSECRAKEIPLANGCTKNKCQCCYPDCHTLSKCQDYNGTCIPNSYLCNGVVVPNQCTGTDCQCCVYIPSTCPRFTCSDGTIILAVQRCDGHDDCADKTDEKNCMPSCNLDQFVCLNGTKISSTLACDGKFDCTYGEDEANCDVCQTSFMCNDGSKTIPHSEVCNGAVDCNDGSDEIACGCLN